MSIEALRLMQQLPVMSVEDQYLTQLRTELGDLKAAAAINQHQQRKLQVLITMIENR